MTGRLDRARLKALPAWLLIGLVAASLGVVAVFSTTWRALELRGFDWLTVMTRPQGSVLPITIIGIDEASFAQIGQRWPWPRSLHARLVDRLVQGGAAVIFFDIVMAEKASPEEDEAFAQSIGAAGNVILASDQAYQETASVRQWLRVDPLSRFIEAGAVSGLAAAPIDGDAVMRRFPDAEDILWRRVVEVMRRVRPDIDVAAGIPERAMVRHLGPAHTFPYVSYYQVVNGDASIPPDFFQDQIVLVGRDVRASPEVGAAQADLFATPFLSTSQLMTPGVEIHATLVENALTGSALAPWDEHETSAVLLALAVLALPALRRWHPLGSGLWIASLAAGVTGASYGLFAFHAQWLPTLAIVATLMLMYVGMGLTSYLTERQRSRQIKDTFSRYVAAQVVEQMVANPDLVRLGGERRELTLLFSDLAGFTSISERLSPENVARVVNIYLTEMTRVVIQSGGTVDKFIGDAVMAFWGAPLDDPAHARHGVEAAQAMQQALARIGPELAELGAAGVSMRIGVHSGPAVVGNMGSEERFDYTAMGDTVNLASRLEGLNKFYGTPILVSGSTAEQVGTAIPLRLVDRVRVKGKAQAVTVYTPCADAALTVATEAAFQMYHAGQWENADAAWRQIQADYPDDSLPPVFLERIRTFIEHPPVDWDGAVSLEKG